MACTDPMTLDYDPAYVHVVKSHVSRSPAQKNICTPQDLKGIKCFDQVAWFSRNERVRVNSRVVSFML